MSRFYKENLPVSPAEQTSAVIGILNGLALSIGMWSVAASFWLLFH